MIRATIPTLMSSAVRASSRFTQNASTATHARMCDVSLLPVLSSKTVPQWASSALHASCPWSAVRHGLVRGVRQAALAAAGAPRVDAPLCSACR